MTRRTMLRGVGLAVAAPLLVAAPAMAATHSAPPKKQDIVAIAASDPQFSTLVTLVKQAGLVKALQAKGPLTVFAPTNAAFNRVPKATLNKLAKNRAALRSVLLYHVAKGNLTAKRVVAANGKSVTTLNGQGVTVTVRKPRVFLNKTARVVKTDVKASNGTIHVINQVLLPPNLKL